MSLYIFHCINDYYLASKAIIYVIFSSKRQDYDSKENTDKSLKSISFQQWIQQICSDIYKYLY